MFAAVDFFKNVKKKVVLLWKNETEEFCPFTDGHWA
jgi:hypothetical protein